MILDQFILLFKSDASQVTKDLGELEKKIDSLRDKGKKRSDQENKDLKEYIKQQKELSQSLKETDAQYNKIAESVAGAVGAYFTLGNIAKGVFGASEVNSNLAIQSKLINQNAVDLKAYGAAAEAAGGDAQSATGYIQGLFENFSSVGLGDRLKKISDVFSQIRKDIKGATPGERERIFQLYNVPQGLKPLLSLPDQEYNAAIKKNKELAENTEAATKIAREFQESWSNVGAALNSVFTSIGTDILPKFQSFNQEIVKFFDGLKDNAPKAEGLLAAGAIGFTVFAASVVGSLKAITSAAAAATGVLAPLLATGASVAGIVDLVSNGEKSVFGKATGSFIDRFFPNAAKFRKSRNKNTSSGESIRVFSEAASDNDTPELAAQRALRDGKSALGIAGSTQIGLGGNSTNSNKNISVKTGDIHVHTNATTSQGIASDIGNDLMSQVQMMIANFDDAVNY